MCLCYFHTILSVFSLNIIEVFVGHGTPLQMMLPMTISMEYVFVVIIIGMDSRLNILSHRPVLSKYTVYVLIYQLI